MATRYDLFVVASFMFFSICLYVVMPKLLLRVRSEKTANLIFLVLWSVMTIVGMRFATYEFF